MKNKIGYCDFIKQISKDTGYAQKDIGAVLESAADVILRNLNDNKETAVFKGMVVYPATYKDEVTFPRARFGRFFKSCAPLS